MFLADTHSDTLFSLGVGKRTFAQTDITPDRLRQGGVSLQTLALWSGPKGPNGDYEAVADAEYAAIRHFTDAGIRQVDDPEDVKPGENTFMLSFEGCEVFQKSDEMVAFWRQRGIRIGALITKNKKLRDYMVKYLTMMMTVSSVFLIKEGSEESLQKREELWEYLKNKNKIMYRMINKMALSKPMQFRSKAGRKIVVWGYSLSQKIYGFN